jgi:hypothetical protein
LGKALSKERVFLNEFGSGLPPFAECNEGWVMARASRTVTCDRGILILGRGMSRRPADEQELIPTGDELIFTKKTPGVSPAFVTFSTGPALPKAGAEMLVSDLEHHW